MTRDGRSKLVYLFLFFVTDCPSRDWLRGHFASSYSVLYAVLRGALPEPRWDPWPFWLKRLFIVLRTVLGSVQCTEGSFLGGCWRAPNGSRGDPGRMPEGPGRIPEGSRTEPVRTPEDGQGGVNGRRFRSYFSAYYNTWFGGQLSPFSVFGMVLICVLARHAVVQDFRPYYGSFRPY